MCGKDEELGGEPLFHQLSSLGLFFIAIKRHCVFTNVMLYTLLLLVSNTLTFPDALQIQ